MYLVVLTLHSYVRWIVVILASVAVVRALGGWLGRKEWTALDRRLGVFFSSSMDLQLLLGLILYIFLSPSTHTAFQDFGAALSNEVLRYWSLEHIGLMLVAVVLVHVGQTLSKRAGEARVKHRQAAIFFGLAILIVLFAIPWPFLPYGRPLIRLN
jgi:putative Ca2+/H+ antiporter (TMEM165/GDT1 family)